MHAAGRRHPLRSLIGMMVAPAAARATITQLYQHPAFSSWAQVPNLFDRLKDPEDPSVISAAWLNRSLATIQTLHYNCIVPSTEVGAVSDTTCQDGVASLACGGSAAASSLVQDASSPGDASGGSLVQPGATASICTCLQSQSTIAGKSIPMPCCPHCRALGTSTEVRAGASANNNNNNAHSNRTLHGGSIAPGQWRPRSPEKKKLYAPEGELDQMGEYDREFSHFKQAEQCRDTADMLQRQLRVQQQLQLQRQLPVPRQQQRLLSPQQQARQRQRSVSPHARGLQRASAASTMSRRFSSQLRTHSFRTDAIHRTVPQPAPDNSVRGVNRPRHGMIHTEVSIRQTISIIVETNFWGFFGENILVMPTPASFSTLLIPLRLRMFYSNRISHHTHQSKH